MVIEEKNQLTCQNCNEVSEPGMLFCIHCGHGLTPAAQKMRNRSTVVVGGKCPKCGKEDDLNMRFCIFCSAPIHPEVTGPIKKFTWEMELADPVSKAPKTPTNAALQFQSAVRKTPTKKPLNFWPIGLAAGAILGGLCAFPGLRLSNAVRDAWLSGSWPEKSITIYTKHPFAQVTLYQPSDSKAFTLAETNAKGTAQFLNVEPGDYNLKISGKGLRTSFEQLQIETTRPTVIGYGDNKEIELAKDPQSVDAAPDSAKDNSSTTSTNPSSSSNAETTSKKIPASDSTYSNGGAGTTSGSTAANGNAKNGPSSTAGTGSPNNASEPTAGTGNANNASEPTAGTGSANNSSEPTAGAGSAGSAKNSSAPIAGSDKANGTSAP